MSDSVQSPVTSFNDSEAPLAGMVRNESATFDNNTCADENATPRLTINQDDVLDIELVPKVVQNELFLIPPKYAVESIIGRGSYGVVVSAQDEITKEQVAIKKCLKIFPVGQAEQTLIQQRNQPISKSALLRQTLIPKRILREMKILAHLSHPNVVNLKSLVPPPSYKDFKDVYFVNELMEADLRDFLVTDQKLSDRHVQYLMFQILSAIAYIHSADILHRDLKPENILVNSNCEIKVCDFGLARGLKFDDDPTMSTNYVQTRWYRAPELLLNHRTVTKQVDMWSVGCIMGELMGGGILFRGSSPINQIEKILSVLGTQEIENVKGSPQGLDFIRKMPHFPGKSLEKLLPRFASNSHAIDLLKQMLQFNPEKRISAEGALRHPYFAELFNEKTLILAKQKFDFRFENEINDLISIKREAFETILEYNGVIRRPNSPGGLTMSTPKERSERIQKIKESMRSPVAIETQNDLIKTMAEVQITEVDVNTKEGKKKSGIMNKMRKMFGRAKCM